MTLLHIASLFALLKKGIVGLPIKKKASIRIGRLTQSSQVSTDTASIDNTKSTSKPPIRIFWGNTKGKVVVVLSSPRSKRHFHPTTILGLVHSLVLTTWELASKVQSQHSLPHNLRIKYLTRRAVHYFIGYGSLFGTYETTRRLLLHSANPLVQLHETTLLDTENVDFTRNVITLSTAFLAGGIAGQVHQFVSS